jgi:hypothetical protein
MKISDKTFDILKNFSTINPSIIVKSGNKIRTVSEQKNILAQAIVEEQFPYDFAIYELNQFLGLASIFDNANADFLFSEKDITISEGDNASTYTYTDPSMVTAPPDQNLELPSVEVDFRLAYSDLKRVIDGANQLNLPEIIIMGSDGKVELVANDSKNPTSNTFRFDLNLPTNDTYQFVFKVEALKMIQDDYEVKISKRGVSHFKGSYSQYWIATEAGSNYHE